MKRLSLLFTVSLLLIAGASSHLIPALLGWGHSVSGVNRAKTHAAHINGNENAQPKLKDPGSMFKELVYQR